MPQWTSWGQRADVIGNWHYKRDCVAVTGTEPKNDNGVGEGEGEGQGEGERESERE